jgi:hypothetical protein
MHILIIKEKKKKGLEHGKTYRFIFQNDQSGCEVKIEENKICCRELAWTLLKKFR